MSYALLSETYPVARKQHVCIWCGQKILIGEKYRSENSVYDGNMQYHKWHLECDKAFRDEPEEEFTCYEQERPTAENSVQYDPDDKTPLF